MVKVPMKSLLFGAAFISLVTFGSYEVGAQGFRDPHEEEHLRREAEAYSNGLKDGSLEDGLTLMDKVYLSTIKEWNERKRVEEETRAKNNAEALARLENHREILSKISLLVKTSDGDWVLPKTVHGPGPLSN